MSLEEPTLVRKAGENERVIERVEVGGERIVVRFDEPATASPLVVLYLHGFGSRQEGEKATYFRRRALAGGWAFCSFDCRGHGASEGSLRELTLTRNLEDVAAVRAWLEERGHRRIALFGSSMGGATALWHAAREPEDVVAVAGIAPALGMAASMERWAGEERLARWERDGVIHYENELVASELSWELIADLRRYDLAELHSRHRVPAILFQGQLDESVDWRDVAAFAAAARPGTVDLRLFPRGDHRLLEQRELLWELARQHFARRLPGV